MLKLHTVLIPALLVVATAPHGRAAQDIVDDPVIIKTDSGARAGHVNLEALPSRSTTNTLKKRFTVESLEHVRSVELLLFAALRDPSDRDSYAFDTWEWIFFNLNGHEWVMRVEDLPMHRRSLFDVNWDDVHWAAIEVPDAAFVKQGVNELIIWNNNIPTNRKDKFFLAAYDDSGASANSFSLADGKWTSDDLNGDRDGAPRGEWMIRLKLNRRSADEQKHRDAVGPARYRQAVEEKKEFVWGFTDAMHRVFTDRPYTGALGNTWQIDAARNEYESCQLVMLPVSVDMLMAEVLAGDFTGADGAVIAADAVTVRVVRTAGRANHQWPDPLPPAYPLDIPRGAIQSYWITVHVPADAAAGDYQSELTITSMSTGGRDGRSTKVPLKLRVRDFALPRISRYQIVSAASGMMRDYHISNTTYLDVRPGVKKYLDKDDNIRVEFDEFDRKMEIALAQGRTTFSVGLAMAGANNFTPECFDWWIAVEGQSEKRRIWVCPFNWQNPDDVTPAIRQSRKWFTQYLSQLYEHLESKGWTQYFWVYGADEPHNSKWDAPLTRYFELIKQIAPNLRIMITYAPTDRFGPNVDLTCIMMNHLRKETIETARRFNQELWCYSCGHLNNPALTLQQPVIAIRLWYWLQHKWGVQRVLLWQTSVYGRNFQSAGVDGRGDGQVFWHRNKPNGQSESFPSIRAEMLRDGIEDREYLTLLAQLAQRYAQQSHDEELLNQAQALATVPDDLVTTQWQMTRDPQALTQRRTAIADMIEDLGQLIDQ